MEIADYDFNPRSREGSDRALPRRVRILPDFNPRSREGSDSLAAKKNAKTVKFQSTLPRRERQFFGVIVHGISVFQSTLPRRERLFNADENRADILISIHAPAKGATRASEPGRKEI